MKLFAVAGNPILHSRSPFLFNAAYNKQSNNFAYFRLHADNAAEALNIFTKIGLKAMNITAPLKSEMIHLVNNPTMLDACNVIIRNNNGSIFACNTDIDGVTGALCSCGVEIDGKKCLVIGAGGAGNAAVYGLSLSGGKVTVANRSIDKAKIIANKVGGSVCILDDIADKLQAFDIIVNTIPTDILDIRNLKANAVFLDAVYPNKAMRSIVESKGGIYISGDKWLLHQAIPAYRMFVDAEPDVEAMQKLVVPPYPRSVSLIGFMGTGKSSVAPVLAQCLNIPYVDIDNLIIERCGADITAIIKDRGEDYFRRVEYDIIREVLSGGRSVIACGGGAITTPQARQMLHQESIAVWLYVSAERCIGRIGNTASRPLLANRINPVEAASTLLKQRIPLYAQTAWMLVNTQNISAQECAEMIYKEVKRIWG